jgi:hypothetical protein
MPSAYTIDLARSLVLTRGWGVATDRELLAHVRALAADPRFAQHFHQLADLCDVTDVQFTVRTIKELVRLNPFWAGARRALVVTSDEVFGWARLYELLRDEWPDELQIFRTMDDALQWLGVANAKEELLLALSQAPPIPGLD